MLTPSAQFYLDPQRLDDEYERVFAKSWQLIGNVGQVAKAGDYFTTRVGREPLLVTNDNGTLRAFYNVCRHRAGPIAYGCGNAKRLACRYHGWTYDLSGQLVGAPEMDGAEQFDAKNIHLEAIKLHVFGPLIFAALDPSTPPFDEFYPGLTSRCASLGLERMKYVATRDYPVSANWKIYVDNYLEGYHIPLVHPALSKELDYRRYVTENYERYVLQYAPVRAETSQHYRAGNADGQAWYYWLFPNVMLNIYEGQLQTNIVVPIDATTTKVQFDWYSFEPLPDPTANARWMELARFSDEIQAEDAQICSAVQLNLGSRAYRPGPYSVIRESGVKLFHTLMQAT